MNKPVVSPAELSSDGLAVTFRLASGEKVTVRIDDEGPLASAPGFRLHVTSDRGTLLVQPSSGNACILTTPKALVEQERRTAEAAAGRDALKSDKV